MSTQAENASQALVFDLDGTLLRTDSLLEQLVLLLARSPWRLLLAIWSLRLGRAVFKARIAASVTLDPARLAYDEAVLTLARRQAEAGRPLYLATASHRQVADAVARHLGIFAEVFASDEAVNLKGAAKARCLRERFGARGFGYVADAEADLPVWAEASEAWLVAPSTGLLRRARLVCPATEIVRPAPMLIQRLRVLRRALRVHQWAKNALVFVPMLAAHRLGPGAAFHTELAFLSFSLLASSVYLLNDLVDLPHDRLHPTKRRRPFASGELNLAEAPVLIGLTLFGGLAVALALPHAFLGMVMVYYATTLAYSFALKRRMVADVITLAGLYTIRIFAGAAATGIPVSPWLLAFAMFLFLSLAIVKRTTELTQLLRAGRSEVAGRGYQLGDLDMLRGMASSSGYISVLVLALYINSGDMPPLYRHPFMLWGLCPVLLFWISRVLMLAHRGEMHDDPVVFALRDRVSLAAVFVALLVVIAGTL